MNRKINIFIIVALCFGSYQSFSQEFNFLNYTENSEKAEINKKSFKNSILNDIKTPITEPTNNTQQYKSFSSKQNESKKLIKNMDVSLRIGAQVGTGFNKSYFTNNYITPTLSFDLTERLSVIAGIGYSFTRLDNYMVLGPNMEATAMSVNINSVSAYSTLIYKLNDKTNILASALIEESNFGYANGQSNSKTFSELSLGVNYNVTSHFSINAQVNYGNRPYYNGSFSNNGYNMNPGFGF